ncbi:MAG: hypothetical protein M3169_00615 [Candidatus Eremiobacteraeota bacterium]|nr:hypothetical protein [Candidatus Eremiobacteraeota bacterium]
MNDGTRLSAMATAASNGDDGAQESLVRLLWPNAYRIAWSILGERGAAEDAAQAACAVICTKLSTLSNPGAFVAWAYRIVVSHARAFDPSRGPSHCRGSAAPHAVLDRHADGITGRDALAVAHVLSEAPRPRVALAYEAKIANMYYMVNFTESTGDADAVAPVRVRSGGPQFTYRQGGHAPKNWDVPVRRWKHGDIAMSLFAPGLPRGHERPHRPREHHAVTRCCDCHVVSKVRGWPREGRKAEIRRSLRLVGLT